MGTFSDAAKNQMIDNVVRGTASPFAGAVYAKLHTGDPGSAGANNAAVETARKAVTFAATSAGSCVSNADVVWTNVAGSETISWMSFWDANAAGNFLGRDDLPVAKAVSAGDTLTLPSGNLTLAI